MKSVSAVLLAIMTVAAAPCVTLAADAPAKATAAANDVSGTWDAVVETQQGSGTPVFTLKQDGDQISGTYKGQFGEAPLKGTVKGNKVSFTFTANAGEELKMEYNGTFDGATMKGTAKFGDYGEGTFTAKKRAK